jgi:hypothetical protein
MGIKPFVFLLSLFVVAQASFPTFFGNVSFASQDEFQYRDTNTWTLNVLALNYFATSAVSVDLNLGKQTASSDGVFSFTATGVGYPPVSLLAFYEASLNVSFNFEHITNPVNFDFSASAGLLASSLLRLEEVDSSGNVVQTISLTGGAGLRIWTYSGADSSVGKGGLRGGVYKFSNLLTLTVLTSDVTGILNLPGHPIIVPKAIELVLEITNFPYQDSKNKVQLVMGVASAKAKTNGPVHGSLYFGNTHTTSTYIDFNSHAQTDGKLTAVSISANATTNIAASVTDLVSAIINGKFQASAEAKIIKILFNSPGAQNIVYDPTLGSGSSPSNSGAYTLQVGFFFLFILFLTQIIM